MTHGNYIREILDISVLREKPKRFCHSASMQSQLKYNGSTASDSKTKAKVLNEQYHHVFTEEDLTTIPDLSTDSATIMKDSNYNNRCPQAADGSEHTQGYRTRPTANKSVKGSRK